MARILGHVTYGTPQPSAKAGGESAPLPALGAPDGEKATPASPHEAVELRRAQWRERKQRQARRQKAGVFIIKLDVYPDAIDAAISRGDITEEEADSPPLLCAALEDLVNHWLLKGR
jgi:hypothetical protein